MLLKISRFIDCLMDKIGRAVSWLMLGMVVATLTIIFLGLFNYGKIWLQDSVTYMHGILFMSAAGYAFLYDSHVRIDVFYGRFSAKRQAIVNLIGTSVLLLPMLAAIFWYSWPYVARSWSVWEGAFDAGGLPATFLFKTFILIFCVLVGMQGVSQVIKSILIIKGDLELPAHRQTETLLNQEAQQNDG